MVSFISLLPSCGRIRQSIAHRSGGFHPRLSLAACAKVGISGYLLWNDLSCEIVYHCLTIVLKRDLSIISQSVLAEFVGMHSVPAAQQDVPVLVPLSAREQAVLERLAEGLSYEQIAQIEPISLRTVERIVANLERKFDAPNHFVLAKKASQLGLIR